MKAGKERIVKGFTIFAIILAILTAYADEIKDAGFVSKSLRNDTVTAPNGAITTQDALKVDKLFGANEKVVDEVTEGVYQIRGWGLAHTIAFDAPEGWIIVDTGDSTKTAADMRKRLEEKVGKKIKVAAILYTHSHYTDGTDAWLDEGAEIWGHEDLDENKRADTGVSILSGNFQTRAATQFGVLHPTKGPDAFPNKLGFGPDKMGGDRSYRAPTQTFEDGKTLNLTIAGEAVEVAPNRTDVKDSVGFYFTDRNTLVTNALGGGAIFNLYSLRGDLYRDPADFIEAHDWALSKDAEVLADIHGPGINGKEAVRENLERARDQIQLIHDQTFRMVARGMDARRAAESVYMPSHMRDGWETYGQVESHVKQVYNGRLGWMGNDVYDINPLSVNEESKRMVDMMGGTEKVRAAAQDALDEGGFSNWSWALKLTSLLLEIDQNDQEAQQTRAASARALGQRTTSANARGWYITEALAMENKLKLGEQPVTLQAVRAALGTPSPETIMSAPLEDSFQYVRYLVDPAKAEDTRLAFTVSVEGAEAPTRIELRNSVVIISEASAKEKAHIDVSSTEWAEFVVGQRSLADGNKTIATFESVLAQPAAPGLPEAVDDQLDEIGEAVDDSNMH